MFHFVQLISIEKKTIKTTSKERELKMNNMFAFPDPLNTAYVRIKCENSHLHELFFYDFQNEIKNSSRKCSLIEL
jgi:hypothetical protein